METLTFYIKNYKDETLKNINPDLVLEKNIEALRASGELWNKEELEQMIREKYKNEKQNILSSTDSYLNDLIGFTYTYEEGREDLNIEKNLCSPEKLYLGLKDKNTIYLDCNRILRTNDPLVLESKIKDSARKLAENYIVNLINNIFGEIYSKNAVINSEFYAKI
jgi:hypothetical protein